MKNRVLMIAFHFPPQAGSSGIQRTLSFSKYLGQYGWDPLVLSASPSAYSDKNNSQLASIPRDIVVKRAFALDSKRHLGIRGRYLEVSALPDQWITWWLSAVPSGLQLIRQHKPAAIWSTFPIATSHLIAMTLRRITGLPWIADFRDPMLQQDYPTSAMRRKCYAWIERQAILKCDKAVFTTFAAMDAYKRRFPESLHGKFSVIENGYDDEAFNVPGEPVMPAASFSGRKLTLLHSGVLYREGRNPASFLEAISRLKARGTADSAGLEVILRAPGDIPYAQGLVDKYRISDMVKVEAPIPYHEALREMLNSDGLLVFQGSTFNTQVPAKIYEYFRARKPIFGLLDPIGETAVVLRNAGFQDIAQIESVDDIERKLEQFLAQVRDGNAHVASPTLVASSSRQYRARELGELFNGVAV